jgi:selenocysteine lyase/cysteine desulfurase
MNDIAKFVGNAEEFPVLSHWDFYNHAGASPLPHVVANAIRQYANDAEQASYLIGNRYGELDPIRALTGSMVGADADEIALLKNTAEGISIVANALDWRAGDRIVTAGGEYPANVYPWMNVCRSRGAELVMVPEIVEPAGHRHVPLDQILKEASHPRTRIVTLSHVEFATGQRHDLHAIGAFCRERGKRFCIDAIQSLGALPLNVRDMNIDYLACGGQKWLLGPEGAAIFYCRRELIDSTPPLVIGAINVVNNMNFGEYDFTLQPTAGRFESGTYSFASLLGMQAAMKLLHSIGAAAISSRIQRLTDHLIEGLKKKGYAIASPRTQGQWSGIVSFASKTHDPAEIARVLRREHRTEVAVREGRIRVSPHFYNTEEQVDRLIQNLPGD